MALVALVLILFLYDDAVKDWTWPRYAESHPLSAALYDAARTPNGTEEQKRILFKRIPRGTKWDEAKQIMIAEEFSCVDPTDYDHRRTLGCMHYRSRDWQPHWYIEFKLDDAGRLVDAKTGLLK